MLLLNKTLIRLAKGLWGWIIAIVALRFLSLIAITRFAGQISGFLGNMVSPDANAESVRSAILAALATSVLMLVSLRELRSRIAVLEQDTYLFDDTIAANIAFGKPGASREEIEEAAKGAGIDEFIRSLPDGYETQMGQMGSRLSGGERQRIGIARCLIIHPDVIIMDEPTSSLDVLHEKELISALRSRHGGKTLLMISHRMSTLTDCRRILRIENGRAAEV